MIINNNANQREAFRNAQIALINANANVPGFDVNMYKLTQSYLALEQLTVTNNATYNFQVLINQGAQTNSEQRLNQQDSFVINQIKLYLIKKASATDTAFLPMTYADQLVFTVGLLQYNKLWNGALNVSVNNSKLVTAWDLIKHKNVPRTQSTVTLQNSNDYSTDGGFPMEPNIILVGSKNNQIQITLPEAFGTIDPFTYIRLQFEGILAQNSTVVS